MIELQTAVQMRAIEQAAIDSGEVTGLELMERAGTGVVETIYEEWPELDLVRRGLPPLDSPGYLNHKEVKRRAVVLCGPGSNGGDGFVVARLLKARGWEVEVFLYGDAEKLPPDARRNYERWLELGKVANFDDAPDSIERCPDLVVDAVFGTGLSRVLDRELVAVLSRFSQQFVVSLDIPSGIDADSGKLLVENGNLTEIFSPALVATFHRAKPGHYLNNQNESDVLRIVDIGLPTIAFGRVSILDRSKLKIETLKGVIRLNQHVNPAKHGGDHKYTHGHSLILAGPSGKGGAARLAARGALRIGAGLVTVGCPPAALQENASQLNAIMVRMIGEAGGMTEVLKDNRFSSLCLGPGLGLNKATEEMVKIALESGRNCVLDADALSIFENNEDALFSMLHENVVLTPHGGEFKRLFPDIAAKLEAMPTKGPAYSKVDATRDAAARAGCTVLFKGPDTVIADHTGRCSINSAHYERATPWLATAGSGDVLAGFIAGLLARGFAPMYAAETAAWLHVECALSFGPGLIAEDLPEELPKVFRKQGL